MINNFKGTDNRELPINKIDISIVIPAYNEEKRLEKTLQRILTYLQEKDCDYEIIVVDDGSRDETLAVAGRFSQKGVRSLRNDRNRGKGYTVRHGMLDARKSFVLFSDADLSTPIEEMENLIVPIISGEAQIAIGSRAIHGARIEVSQPFYRIAMGKIFNMFVRLIALGGIHDTQCGFKLFTREAAQEVFRRQQIPGFGFDVEVLAIARQLGYKIAELPVRWINSAESKVDALHDSSAMFFDLLRVRLNILRGRYR